MIFESVAELRAEADEARHLASTLDNTASIADLFKYAASLETDADFLSEILSSIRRTRARVKRVNASKIIQLPGGMEAMNKKTWPKAKYVVRRDGSLLTLGDLPSPKTIRWVIGRKTIVVDAVRGGLISLEDACWRYSLTLEEFSAWQTAVDRRRPQALSTGRVQERQRSCL